MKYCGNGIVMNNKENKKYSFSIPEYSLPRENLSDIERAPGTERQYLGQPDMLLLDDDETLITVYPIGHGAGPIVMRISRNRGQTWEEKKDLPLSWKSSYETPTLYKLDLLNGQTKLIMITGLPDWHGNNQGGWRTSLSHDKGQTWEEYRTFHPTLKTGEQNHSLVAMASLIQLRDAKGRKLDKWMGVYHDIHFVNYRTYLTFDSEGNEQWSTPEPYLVHYRNLEQEYQICEVGLFRSPDGKRIVGLARTQSHRHGSVMFYSDDEGDTWTKPKEVSAALLGERHKIIYDPSSQRLLITFREMILDVNCSGEVENDDWVAGDWIAWIGTYDDLMNGHEGQYRIRIAEDWTNSPKSGDTGYAGLTVTSDGLFLLNSYGHWDREFSANWSGAVTQDLSYIKLASFKLEQVDRALGFVRK